MSSKTSSTAPLTTQLLPLPIPKDSKKIAYELNDFPSKDLFETNTTYAALIVPSKRTSAIRKLLSDFLLQRPKTKNVYKLDDDNDEGDVNTERKIVLNSSLEDDDNGKNVYDNSIIKELLLEMDENNNNNVIRKSKFCLRIGYDDLSVEEALRKILPWKELSSSTSSDNNNNEFLIPSAFETIGHIAHVNLRDEHLPYRKIIGKVILDKNLPRITMVVNKIGNVQGEFRTFPMEVLASSTEKINYEVELREEKCRFIFNFKDVYWNSRLMGEHRRVVQLIGNHNKKLNKNNGGSGGGSSSNKNKKRKLKEIEKDNKQTEQQQQSTSILSPKPIIVADVMAGVGPFSVPLTSSHMYENIIVYANDLNPKSYQYLNENSKLNKCQKLNTYNMDGRKFIHYLVKEKIMPNYIIMNLPADAPEFLNSFRGLWKEYNSDTTTTSILRPTIFVHCFAEKENINTNDDDDDNDNVSSHNKAICRCETALGCTLDRVKDDVNVHIVRDIAPKKNMLCISFKLPIMELSKLEPIDI